MYDCLLRARTASLNIEHYLKYYLNPVLMLIEHVLLCHLEYCGGRLRVPLPAGEIQDLPAEPGGEELPHLLPAVCWSLRGHQDQVPPGITRRLQGECGLRACLVPCLVPPEWIRNQAGAVLLGLVRLSRKRYNLVSSF